LPKLPKLPESPKLQALPAETKEIRPGAFRASNPIFLRGPSWSFVSLVVQKLPAIMVVIVVTVSAMASFPRFFQIVTAGLRLAAVFTVLALGIVQSALRIADSLLALSVVVVVTVKGPRRDRSAQER
jgi:hypothetical protein